MTQDWDQAQRAEERQSAERVAEALDAAQVERIIRRAVELQVDEDLAMPALDEPALERIASELGIDREHLRRAIAEAKTDLTRPENTLLDRLFAPQSITESRIVRGDRDTVEARIIGWMRRHEGMRIRRRNDSGALWEKDPHIFTKVRMGLRMGRGTPALRTRAVAHRLQTVKPGEQAVALEASTRGLRDLGTVGATAAGVLAGIGTGVGLSVANVDPIVAVPAGMAAAAVGFGGVVLGVKMWLSRVRDGLRRAFDGIETHDLEEPDPIETRIRTITDMFNRIRGRH